jgi:nicotinate-nucleotide adenylyltransferase
MRKVCLFGGAFDPIHAGHLAMARDVVDLLHMDRVIFIPTATPPHKNTTHTPFAHRLEMVKIVARRRDAFAVSDMEEHREGPSYTVDTLRQFHDENKNTQIYFLIGTDWIRNLASWKDIDEVFSLCRFIVVPRYGFIKEHIASKRTKSFSADQIANLQEGWLPMKQVEASSTQIRKLISENRPIGKYVLPEVREYMAKHGLYGYKPKRKKRPSRVDRRRRRLASMFEEQKGLCHYCNKPMELPVVGEGRQSRQPRNQATIEHLEDRYDKPHGKYAVRGTVAACRRCNNQKAKQRNAERPIEDLWERSGRPPGGACPDLLKLLDDGTI